MMLWCKQNKTMARFAKAGEDDKTFFTEAATAKNTKTSMNTWVTVYKT